MRGQGNICCGCGRGIKAGEIRCHACLIASVKPYEEACKHERNTGCNCLFQHGSCLDGCNERTLRGKP
jgi:hypothetical protein